MATKALQMLVRRAVLAKLKADAGVTALVPAARIFPQDAGPAPIWPFIKTGAPTSRPFKQACVDGAEVSFDVHAFARAREAGGAIVETGEDHASHIGGAIETCLADHWIDLPDGIKVRLRLSDFQLMQDDEPGAFHYVAQVNAKVLAPA